jgi:arylsulfatase A-like enzyme
MRSAHSRRDFLKLAVLAAGQAASARVLPGWSTSRPHNVVFIIVDQHSGLALGCAGHRIVRTPRLDGMAREGVIFTHAYTAGLVCAPSRASMDTSLCVHTHGVRDNGIALRDDCNSVWNILEKHGYEVYGDPRRPSGLRKDYFAWLRERGYGDVANPYLGSPAKAEIIPTPYRYEVGRLGLGVEETPDAYAVRDASRFLERQRSGPRPFGLWVRLHGPHDPWVVPAPYDTMYRPADLPLPPYRAGEYDSKPVTQKRVWQGTGADQLTDEQLKVILAHYLGLISYSDMLVGRLLDKLSALGLDDDTVVVYTADHGDTMGLHRIFTKGFACYEPAVRIPLILRAPGTLGRGVHVDGPVSNVDFLPTMLELMGLPGESGLHGRSLAPAWRGDDRRGRDEIFAGEGYEGFDRIVMLRTAQWKLARYDEGGGELYDLQQDRYELRNLYHEPKYAGIVRRLTRQLEDWDLRYPHATLRLSPETERSDPERARRIREAFEAWRKKSRTPSASASDG